MTNRQLGRIAKVRSVMCFYKFTPTQSIKQLLQVVDYHFLSQLYEFGYLEKVDRFTYKWTKTALLKDIDKSAKFIALNGWGTELPICSKLKHLEEFTNQELINELKRRKINLSIL